MKLEYNGNSHRKPFCVYSHGLTVSLPENIPSIFGIGIEGYEGFGEAFGDLFRRLSLARGIAPFS